MSVKRYSFQIVKNQLNKSKKLKRGIDFFSSIALLTFLLPALIFIGISIFLSSGRPIFFKQSRPGYKGKLFKIIKFRTMRPPRNNEDHFHTDASRLTQLGKLLRKTSLDELPVLWNVIRGEMSLVGPRPLVVEYLSKYTLQQMRRHDVIPGITGWAQINGRQNITFKNRILLDVWYVDNWSIGLDMKIFIKSIKPVLFGSGVLSGQNISEVDDIGFFTNAE